MGTTEKLNFCFQDIITLKGAAIVFLETDVALPDAVSWVMMQRCFGSYFMLVLEKQEIVDGRVKFYAGNFILFEHIWPYFWSDYYRKTSLYKKSEGDWGQAP